MYAGMRDTEHAGHPGIVGVARDLGYPVITMDEFVELGVTGLVERIHTHFANMPIYLCWDMDVIDPSASPGVVTPSWGGITAREGLAILRGLRGLEFVAFDITPSARPTTMRASPPRSRRRSRWNASSSSIRTTESGARIGRMRRFGVRWSVEQRSARSQPSQGCGTVLIRGISGLHPSVRAARTPPTAALNT